jgi:hypothetical protein
MKALERAKHAGLFYKAVNAVEQSVLSKIATNFLWFFGFVFIVQKKFYTNTNLFCSLNEFARKSLTKKA